MYQAPLQSYLSVCTALKSGTELTHPQTQKGGIILADPDPELCSLWDGLGNPVVDTTVKLENVQVVLFLTAGISDIPETHNKCVKSATTSEDKNKQKEP